MKKLLLILLTSYSLAFAQMVDYQNRPTLTRQGAVHLAALPLKCIEKEYPYKTGIVLTDSSLAKNPRSYHPIFYGCFDWHSSVHGHWSLARLLRLFPDLPQADEIRRLFDRQFTAENVARELALFRMAENRSFERTYGWGWLLQLETELLNWQDPDAQRWAAELAPLAAHIRLLVKEFLPKIAYPIRSGEHTNLAFGLKLILDNARTIGDTALVSAIILKSREFYLGDKNCPLAWEPSGYDFLSPCLEQADLMRRVLPVKEFNTWFSRFLPKLQGLEPAEVRDRTDGKLVHLDGLNLSRAWCLLGLAEHRPNLKPLAIKHLEAGLRHIFSGDYAGEHWLGSFAIYALTH